MSSVINGDCIKVMAGMPASSVDMIFADPPYWMRTVGKLLRVEGTEFDGCDDAWDQFESLEDYSIFTQRWLEECHRLLKPNGTIWVIGGMQCIYTIGAAMQEIGYWLINDVIWHKKNPTPNFMGTRLNNSHETLIWAAKSKKSRPVFNYKTAKELNTDTVSPDEHARGVRKQMGSVWRMPICAGRERLKDDSGGKLHSTQKPEELLYRVIAISTKIGDVVLDPFAGTMTTGAAAKRLGREYIMIERDAGYCAHGAARIEAEAYEASDVAEAAFDRRPPKASLADLMTSGRIEAGETFYLKDGRAAGAITPEGKIMFGGELLDIHTCAARARGAKADRLNGYDVWYVMRGNGLVSIASIRDSYRAAMQLAANL